MEYVGALDEQCCLHYIYIKKGVTSFADYRLSLSSLFAFIQANSTSSANGTAASKKDSAPLPKTPLQKLLSDAGPLKSDGSDKFFGMENVGLLL